MYADRHHSAHALDLYHSADQAHASMGANMGETGCDVLLQSDRLRSCEGLRGVVAARSARMLVRGGEGSSVVAVAALRNAPAEAPREALRTIGAAVVRAGMPCAGGRREQCMAADEPHTRNVLVWVGSNGAPSPLNEAKTAHRLLDEAGRRAPQPHLMQRIVESSAP